MKPLSTVVIILVYIVLHQIGCGVTGDAAYSTTVGTATATDIRNTVPRILSKYQYQISRVEESSDQIYVQTQWNNRTPFEDEYDAGVKNARTRIIIEARPRTRVGTILNTVRFTAENMVLFDLEGDWENRSLSQEGERYIRAIVNDLKADLDMGVRTF